MPAATATEPIDIVPVPAEAAAEPPPDADPAVVPEIGANAHAALFPNDNPATTHGVVSELI